AYNKNIKKKQQQHIAEVVLSKVRDDMNKFNDLFFVWNTWGEYDKNIKDLQQRYPKIDEGKKVDISGKDVGSGKSPESSYNGNFYTTTNKNEIAEKVTQSKDSIRTKTSTVWFIVGDRNDNDMINIYQIKKYK